MNLKVNSSVNRLLPGLYQIRGLAEWPQTMLESLSAVIPNLFATCIRIDLRSGNATAAYFPEEWKARVEAIMPLIHPHTHTHPIYRHVIGTGDGSPRFTADFYSEEDWRQTPFAGALAPLGVQECLIFCLQTSRQELIFISLNRSARTFTERDRKIAEMLRPHFTTAYENALAYTEVQALAAISELAMEQHRHGIVVIDDADDILHLSPPAGDLLDCFFPQPDAGKMLLPPTLLHWLASDAAASGLPAKPLLIEGDHSTLIVRAASSKPKGRILHLREEVAKPTADHLKAYGLTPREIEVMQWVSQGKSNPEIGTILAISPRTVAKHLQVIFDKLGVEGRISALLLAKGI